MTIQNGLATWAQLHGGTIHIAHDASHLFRLLGDNPGAARIGILLHSEKPRNETFSDVETRMDRHFWVCVSRGYTLELFPGKSLTQGVAGGKPMFVLVREAAEALRALRFDAAGEPQPYYLGYELLTFEGVSLDAYKIAIAIASELQAEVVTPTDLENE